MKNPSGSWEIEMRQIYRGNNKIQVNKFDNSQYDLVAVYVEPTDKVVIVDASKVHPRSLTIKELKER